MPTPAAGASQAEPAVPEDHLGLMLAFLAVTAMRAEAPKGSNSMQNIRQVRTDLVEAIMQWGTPPVLTSASPLC